MPPHIESVAHAFADDTQGEENRREQRRRKEQHAWRIFNIARAIGNERAEAGHRLLHAEAEKGKKALEQEDPGGDESQIGDDRTDKIGDDMAYEYAAGARAERFRR